ncbi:MAG: hypothetical protein K0S63_1006 [Gammaproteobacteria bacterium]|jgi:uncharacterized protein (DUF1330 family)|nr:hypothetical protein [Gammaproteobacteria bacterium]
MSAYIIGQVTVHDSAEFNKYLSHFMSAFIPFSGKVLVSSEQVELMEGQWPNTRTIIFEFPTIEHAKRWYNSEEYQKILQHRFKAATANIVLVDGFELKASSQTKSSRR